MTETPVESVERISLDRPLRICDVCGQVDDHPRHLVAAALGEIPVNQENLSRVLADASLDTDTKAALIADIVDTTTQDRHFDCCTNVGCPDGTCDRHPNELTGTALLEAILAEGPSEPVITPEA
jgi:hypothetical protein